MVCLQACSATCKRQMDFRPGSRLRKARRLGTRRQRTSAPISYLRRLLALGSQALQEIARRSSRFLSHCSVPTPSPCQRPRMSTKMAPFEPVSDCRCGIDPLTLFRNVGRPIEAGNKAMQRSSPDSRGAPSSQAPHRNRRPTANSLDAARRSRSVGRCASRCHPPLRLATRRGHACLRRGLPVGGRC